MLGTFCCLVLTLLLRQSLAPVRWGKLGYRDVIQAHPHPALTGCPGDVGLTWGYCGSRSWSQEKWWYLNITICHQEYFYNSLFPTSFVFVLCLCVPSATPVSFELLEFLRGIIPTFPPTCDTTRSKWAMDTSMWISSTEKSPVKELGASPPIWAQREHESGGRAAPETPQCDDVPTQIILWFQNSAPCVVLLGHSDWRMELPAVVGKNLQTSESRKASGQPRTQHGLNSGVMEAASLGKQPQLLWGWQRW